jgi:(1->4)-alpha-D-glucan 1-alpha-D-glucosylmutase
MPDEWEMVLDLWRETVAPHLSQVDDAPAPDANDQIILLQALLGTWPLELLDGDGDDALSDFRERMEGYIVKALREAKRHTSWVAPDEAYEGAALLLLRALLATRGAFMEGFRPIARRLALLGTLNGLSRTVLKATLPGVPDIYQGTELWDFSLVDPDNRRPVDYAARARMLDADEPLDVLLANWRDGRIKQRVLSRLLRDRAEAPALYAEGDYQPLAVDGLRAAHLIAFSRKHGAETLVVVVPRLWARLGGDGRIPIDGGTWGDTTIALPRGTWRDAITGDEVVNEEDRFAARDLFAAMPFAVLRSTS